MMFSQVSYLCLKFSYGGMPKTMVEFIKTGKPGFWWEDTVAEKDDGGSANKGSQKRAEKERKL